METTYDHELVVTPTIVHGTVYLQCRHTHHSTWHCLLTKWLHPPQYMALSTCRVVTPTTEHNTIYCSVVTPTTEHDTVFLQCCCTHHSTWHCLLAVLLHPLQNITLSFAVLLHPPQYVALSTCSVVTPTTEHNTIYCNVVTPTTVCGTVYLPSYTYHCT